METFDIPFDLFIFQLAQSLLDLCDIDILAPGLLALTRRLLELLRSIQLGRHGWLVESLFPFKFNSFFPKKTKVRESAD